MTAPRQIGYLVPQFPGQTHIFFWREINELSARGVEPVLMSTRPPPPGLIAHNWSDEAARRTEYLGRLSLPDAARAAVALPWPRIIRAAKGEPRAFWKDIALSAAAAVRLTRLCRARGIDHVHVHSCGRAALIAALARLMDGPAYSLTLHGPLSDYGPGQRLKWKHAAFATVITRKLIAEMETALPGDLPDRMLLQPMGVDTEALTRTAPYAPARPGGPLRLFSCGRLNEVKGHHDLMAAVAQMRAEGREVTLEIAGEDDAGGSGYRAVLEARIAELGLGDAVTLLGAVDGETVKARLCEAHIFVLASYHEPLGVAYMEAMSCEVPVVGTDAGGVPELISHGEHGLLVPPRAPEALAAAIAQIADDPELAQRLSQAGRRRVVEQFHAGRGAETLIDAIFGPGH